MYVSLEALLLLSNREMSNSSQRRKQVCLFGTSADPPTGKGGHLGIAQHLASMDDLDEVRILPVYRHMLGVSLVHLCCIDCCTVSNLFSHTMLLFLPILFD